MLIFVFIYAFLKGTKNEIFMTQKNHKIYMLKCILQKEKKYLQPFMHFFKLISNKLLTVSNCKQTTVKQRTVKGFTISFINFNTNI